MKLNIIIPSLALIVMSLLALDASAANPSASKEDSIAAVLKLKNLKIKREKLQKQIAAEDAKRNRQVAGVTPETNEEMNIRQDSICMALRSQLANLNLQISEAGNDNFKKSVAESVQKLKARNKAKSDSLKHPAVDSVAPVKQKVKISTHKANK
ncbi:MAG: hypothetical protein HDS11_06025 [Bacteroides sp.]|nr:hypothetical protein [Bacteroides sp.]